MTKPVSLIGFTAEAGKSDDFRIHAIYGGVSYSDFAAVNSDEAQYLISVSPYSVSHPKK